MEGQALQPTIEGFRLSPQQRHLWLAGEPALVCFAQCAVALTGGVDTALLSTALRHLLERHEALRTRFESLPGMDVPIQVVEEDVSLLFRTVEADSLPTGAREAEVSRVLAEERGRFDLRCGPPVRFAWISFGREGVLTVTAHPLCADPRSLVNLVADLDRALGGDAQDEVLQYVQFSEWQINLLEEPDGEEARAFWAREAEERLAPIDLPISRTEPGGDASSGPAAVRLSLPAGPLAQAAGPDGSVRALLLTCWGLLLAKLAGAEELPVEVFFAGRKFPELREAVGLFGKYIPVHLRGPGRRAARSEATRIEEKLRSLEKHEELFVREEGFDPIPGSAVGFDYDEHATQLEIVEKIWVAAPFHVRLAAWKRDATVELSLFYDPDRCDVEEARRLARTLESLLISAGNAPQADTADLQMLSDADRSLLAAWNRTAEPLAGELLLHRLFAEQAALTPGELAIQAPDGRVTFGELDQRANRLAHLLAGMGVAPESRVAIALERSLDQIVSVLAVLKAGAAYVPLDPLQPPGRFTAMLADSGAIVLICRGRSVPKADVRTIRLDEESETLLGMPADEPQVGIGLENLAYVLFTSGSTGRPKGTLIEHRSVTNLGFALQRTVYAGLGDGSRRRVTMNAPLSFDASVKQWVQLLRGDSLLIVPEEVRPDGEALLSWLIESRADVLDCTPSQLRLLLDAGLDRGAAEYPRIVLVGGEAIEQDLWDRLAADSGRSYVNVYGPTECTVDSTACRIEQRQSPTIGMPLPNVRVHVVDEVWREVPIGVAGELCVAGAGLARGYAGHSDLTAERFVPDAVSSTPGSRLYRTGDRARFRGDGRLEFLGRADHQVKVRGVRVELGEIEAALARHPGVSRAVAVLRDAQPGRPRLVGYVTPTTRASQKGSLHRLPIGLEVAHQNRNETEYLYEEIFENRCYVRHGISLPADACVIDVGANIGMFTLFVHSECERPRVYAFEPVPAIFDSLARNCELYAPDVKLFRCGLSDGERIETFSYYPRYSMMSGQSGYARPEMEVEVVRRFIQNQLEQGIEGAESLLAEVGNLLADRFQGEQVKVELRRLSDILRQERIERVDLLKVDVQRAELDVLLGIEEQDWGRIDQVVMEVHDAPGERTEGSLRRTRELLERRGFRIEIEQDRLLEGTDRFNLYALRQGLKHRARSEAPAALARLTARMEGTLSADGLRDFARRWLPDYMLPSDLVILDELPYTRHGKVDRAALPAPEEIAAASPRQVAAPRTPVEEVLVGLFAEVLGTDRVGTGDSFFDLGGHSLLATQLMSRVRETFRVELPLRLLFESPAPAQLAEALEGQLRSGAVPGAPPILPVPRQGHLPLSFAQQRLWFLQQLDPASSAYNNPKALRVRGSLSTAVVAATLSELVRRHEVLRTTFPAVQGEPVQHIHPPTKVPLPLVDLCGLSEAARIEEARRVARQESVRSFGLALEAPVRFTLMRLSADDHVLLFILHHIAGDAWSLSVLDREVVEIYRALAEHRPRSLPEIPVQYADYAQWQRRWLQGEVLDSHLGYWKAQLAGAPLQLELSSCGPAPSGALRQLGRSVAELSPELSEKVLSLSRRRGVTLFMTLLSAFGALVSRSAQQDDLVLGTAVAGRDRIETEGLIGFFVNTLPIRIDLSGRPTFLELLTQVREASLGAYMYQNLPFERLVDELQEGGRGARNPIVQVFFGVQNAPQHPLELPGLALEAFETGNDAVRFDLTVWMWEGEHCLRGLWSYDASLFLPETVQRLQRSFAKLLESALNDPSLQVHDLELLAEEDREAEQRKAQALKQSNLERFRAKARPASD